MLGFDLSGYVSDGAEKPLSLVFSSGAELVGQAESQVALPVSQDPGAEPEPDSGTELPAPEPEPGGGAPAAQPEAPEENLPETVDPAPPPEEPSGLTAGILPKCRAIGP